MPNYGWIVVITLNDFQKAIEHGQIGVPSSASRLKFTNNSLERFPNY